MGLLRLLNLAFALGGVYGVVVSCMFIAFMMMIIPYTLILYYKGAYNRKFHPCRTDREWYRSYGILDNDQIEEILMADWGNKYTPPNQ